VTVPFYAAPWRIPDQWTPKERVRGLEAIAQDGSRDPSLILLARDLVLPERMLAWVQYRGYKRDPVPGDWWQGIGWTARNGGDCEDLAALFVALARAGGLRARVVWINQPGQPLNHVSAQLMGADGRWMWAETSIEDAKLGESPYQAAERLHRHEVI
jgi:hypothetical protein